jgi:integrase/recombinase XerD
MKLFHAIDQYLAWKRADHYKFEKVEGNLRQMAKHIGDIELADVKPEQMLGFLNRIPILNSTWTGKYWVIRRFFEYCFAREKMPAFAMPAPRLNQRQSFVPHIYTKTEIRSLLEATKRNRRTDCALDQPTMQAMIVLLYATGLPVGELPSIMDSDLDLEEGFIRIRSGQAHRNRRIPIGTDLCKVLREFKAGKLRIHARSPYLFLTRKGKQTRSASISRTFTEVRCASGVHRRDDSRHQPRISDLRFTFAVHRISAGIGSGDDLNRLLPALTAYMGQVGLGSTARYMALTPGRFKKDLDKLSQRSETGRWKNDVELMKFLDNL